MKLFVLISILLFTFSVGLLGCSEEKVIAESSSTTAKDPLEDTTMALYLNVTAQWEGTTIQESLKTCTVSSLTAPGTTTCAVSVPEGQLYYSSLLFTVASNSPSICTRVVTRPYAYRRSILDGYIPPGEDTGIDCRDGVNEKYNPKCWGGAGPAMITTFPKDRGAYILTASLNKKTYELPSENSLRRYGVRTVNYTAANNLTDKSVDTPNADYLGTNSGYFNDYAVICEDIWAHPIYTIRLVVSDQDTSSGELSQDEIEDWLGN